ncbi:hypothetical protein E2C01_005427 [Portunus trituberculatus]|uniref:Uncharacterized protein n=1 Tax=Portunus trituberculatus TaxID=210409 RepID=A0A5B7CSR9_PORTR|nr:hypothetical protein [Portunus trituberculatus]
MGPVFPCNVMVVAGLYQAGWGLEGFYTRQWDAKIPQCSFVVFSPRKLLLLFHWPVKLGKYRPILVFNVNRIRK